MFLRKRHVELAVSGVVFLLVSFCLFIPTSTRHVIASETSQPIWTIDLKKYGIRTPRGGFLRTFNDPGSLTYVAITSDTVAVIFESHKAKGSQIAALFLDGKAGGVIGQQSWSGDLDYRRQIFATSNGNFVLLTSGQEDGPPPILHLLSATGQELKRTLLQQSEGRNGRWEAVASPSGRSVLLTHMDDGTPDSFQLFDANTLDLRSMWSKTGTKAFVEAISDEDVLFSTPDPGYLIGRFKGPWQTILLLGRPQFLTEDSIIASSIDGSVSVVRDDSQQLNGFRAGVGRSSSPSVELEMYIPFISADGQRFGAVIDERRPFPKPPTRTIDVWQKLGEELIFAAPLHWSGYGFGTEASLSADGSLLVAVNAQKVYAYKLPPYRE